MLASVNAIVAHHADETASSKPDETPAEGASETAPLTADDPASGPTDQPPAEQHDGATAA